MMIPVGPAEDVRSGNVVSVGLRRLGKGPPRQALVLRDAGGKLHCYLNLCRHLPIPLDGGSRVYLAPDEQHLLCGTHGALYRLEDGVCVEGPCVGAALFRLPLLERDGELFILDAAT